MKKGISHILVIMALLFAAGCSKDAADNAESAQESQPASLKVVGLTRATSGNTDWDDIHIYLTSSGTQVAEGKFGYASDTKEWSTHLKLKSGSGTFRLYGFMPDDPSLTASLQNVTTVDAQIKLENVNPLTTIDYCVVTGVRQVETASDHTSATRGMFSFDYYSYRQNYINLFTVTAKSSVNFPRWFLNTFIVAIFSCIISTLAVMMVSYAFSRLRFKARKPLINIGMILGMFPGFMTMIAIYYLLKAMGLLDLPLVALIICYSAGAGLGYQISKGFFDTIPRALDEAATIDGATRNQIFWKIILPMSKPILVYTVLTSFIGPWTDFILAKIIVGRDIPNYTVAIGLQMLLDNDHVVNNFKNFLAGSVVVAVPITTLFLIMQRYYVEGVTAGGVKG